MSTSTECASEAGIYLMHNVFCLAAHWNQMDGLVCRVLRTIIQKEIDFDSAGIYEMRTFDWGIQSMDFISSAKRFGRELCERYLM